MRNLRLLTLVLVLGLLGTACDLSTAGLRSDSSAPAPPPTPPATTAPAPDPTPAPAPDGSSVDDYVRSITDWERVAPTSGPTGVTPTGDPVVLPEEIVDHQAYRCTSRSYSLTENPREVVLADPHAGQLWPGALLDGAAHVQGSLRPIAVDGANRGPLGISVAGGGVLGIRGGISTVVDQPVGSTVREGINQLVANALETDVVTGAGYSSFESVESHSAEQTVLEFGLSARYLGQRVSAELDYARSANQHTYTAYFIQRLYTIAIDAPQAPSDFFAESVSADDLAGLGMGPDNPPLYVGSVSYGRILMYSMTSSASREEISAAIDYSYRGAASVDAEAAARHETVLANATIEVMAVGGSNAGVENLITSGNLAGYFEADLALNQVEPIAFTVNRLSDNQVARVVDATEYEQKVCEVVAAPLPQPAHWWPMDGTLADEVFGADLGGVNEEYVAGAFGQAFPFDGSVGSANTFGEVNGVRVDRILPTDGEFSISAWVNPRSTSLGTIISQVGTDYRAGDMALRVGDPGGGSQVRVYFYRRPSAGNQSVDNQATAAIVPLNTWTHVVAVYGIADGEPTSMRIYVNGELATDQVVQSRYTAVRGDTLTRVGTSELAANNHNGATAHQWPLNGYLDELMVFDRALTADDVALMYQNFGEYKNER